MKRLAIFCLWAVSAGLWAQDAAQPTLPSVTLSIGRQSVSAEVADEPMERQTGLMFRTKLDENSGMLFIMPRPEQANFWMRNTKIPLSIAYISPSGMILEIHDLKPLDETGVKSHFPNIAYALEMDQGWFDKNGVLPGEMIRGLPAAPR